MAKHGGLAEILRTKQAPAGFVRDPSAGGPSSTELSKWRRDRNFIDACAATGARQMKTARQLGPGMHIERHIELTNRQYDGNNDFKSNPDALAFEKRRGNPNIHNELLDKARHG